jgi:hypothetical protein
MSILGIITTAVVSLTSTFFTTVSDCTDILMTYEETDDYTVSCSVVAPNISLDEIVSPTDVIIDGENCAEIFVELLEANGLTPVYSGTTCTFR